MKQSHKIPSFKEAFVRKLDHVFSTAGKNRHGGNFNRMIFSSESEGKSTADGGSMAGNNSVLSSQFAEHHKNRLKLNLLLNEKIKEAEARLR